MLATYADNDVVNRKTISEEIRKKNSQNVISLRGYLQPPKPSPHFKAYTLEAIICSQLRAYKSGLFCSCQRAIRTQTSPHTGCPDRKGLKLSEKLPSNTKLG